MWAWGDYMKSVLSVISLIIYGVLHFWAAYILYLSFGWLIGIIGFCVPVIGVLIAGGIYVGQNGILNLFTVLFVLMGVLYTLASSGGNKDKTD